ncbi:MAG: hypothetical protein ACYC8S_01840 [Minisyncoccota bacterium]
MEYREQNNFEGLSRTPDGALYGLPPDTVCGCGCKTFVESNKPYARINTDGVERFYIEGHKRNREVDRDGGVVH